MDVKMALTLDRLDFLSERPSQPSAYRGLCSLRGMGRELPVLASYVFVVFPFPFSSFLVTVYCLVHTTQLMPN